jgi:hypothetical protein
MASIKIISIPYTVGLPVRFHSRTSYSKATPSGSFSSNQISAASGAGKALDVLGVANLLAGVDVDKNGHWSLLSFRLPQWVSLRLGLKTRVTVQCPHDADPGQHCGAAGLCNGDERLHSG